MDFLEMVMQLTMFFTVLGMSIIAILIVLMFVGFPIMWLWNWLMPVIFGFNTITFWQAVGLHFLISFTLPWRMSANTYKPLLNKYVKKKNV